MQRTSLPFTTKKPLALVSAVVATVLAIGIIAWMMSHARLKIVISGLDTTANTRLSLVSNEGNKTTDDVIKPIVVKPLSPGTYTATIEDGDSSYIAAISLPPLPRSLTLYARMKTEAARTDVATNPGPCMFYSQKRFYSGECYGNVSELSESSTGSAVPINTASSDRLEGSLLGTTPVADGTNIALSHLSDQSTSFQLSRLQSNLSAQKIRDITLRSDSQYTIKPMAKGFIVADTSLSDIHYFASPESEPRPITFGPAKDKTLTNMVLTTNKAAALLYTKYIGGEQLDSESAESGADGSPKKIAGGESEVMLSDGSTVRHFFFSGTSYFAAVDCGTQKLCMLRDLGLDVFDITSTSRSPRKLYTLSGIQNIAITTVGPRFLADKGIISFDFDKKEGHYEYTYGTSMTFSALGLAEKGYIVITADNTGKRTAQYINLEESMDVSGNVPHISVGYHHKLLGNDKIKTD